MTPTHKVIWPIVLGTLLEWAEFTFFIYMLTPLTSLFGAPQAPHMQAYGFFAASYMARPLGALYFGFLGDRIGRKHAILASLTLIACVTVLMGCLPTYQTLGITATWIFLACRILQGLAVAGEFNGASVMLAEFFPKRPYFVSSLAAAAASAGMVLGGIAAVLVTHPQAPEYAWRLPFLFSSCAALLILQIRKHVAESPAFIDRQHRLQRVPLYQIATHEKMAFLRCISLAAFIAIWVYIGSLYAKMCMIKAGINPHDAARLTTFGQILTTCLIPISGLFADRFGDKGLRLGLWLAGPAAVVIFAATQTSCIPYLVAAQIFYAVINALVSGAIMQVINRQFSFAVRYTGASLGWSLAAALFGGSSLVIARLLHQWAWFGPACYIALMSLWALYCQERKASSISSVLQYR